MWKKIQQFESTFHIGHATILIAVFTLLSRIAGFLRDVLLASRLGLSTGSDAYFTAFRLPDLVYNLLILGTLSVAFIPVFSEYLVKDKSKAFRIASSVMNISALGMACICLIILIFTDPLTKFIAPGFSVEQTELTVKLTRLMLISPLIFTISSVFSSVLVSMKKFLIVNLAPLLYNLGIIVGIVFFLPRFGMTGLAYGVILGALLHLCIQIPEALRYGFRWKPIIDYSDKGVQKIAKLFLPRVLGIDNSYINLIIVSVIGSTLLTGSITAYNYATNIQTVALGMFALSSAVAVFPLLSEYFAKHQIEQFINSLRHTIIRVLFFIIPFSILLLLLRAHIVRLLLGYGNCDWNCTITTFNTLGVLALGLVSQSLIPIFARAFYARHNTKTPVIIGFVGMVINGVFSYYLSNGLGIVGVALGFVIACTIQSIILFVFLHRNLEKESDAKEVMHVFSSSLITLSSKILLSSLIMGLFTYTTLYLFAPILNTRTVVGIFAQSAIASATGGIVYLWLTYHFQIRESQTIVSYIKKVRNMIFRQKLQQNQ